MKAGVVVFPGSNCDHDTAWVLSDLLGAKVDYLWHKESFSERYDLIVLPGGFSYGDYLRTGAIARISPVMQQVRAHADQGRYLLGICNGFQIMTEAGLLPGALMTNDCLRFVCCDIYLKVGHRDTAFSAELPASGVIRLPIAHHGGRYVADDQTIQQLEDEDRVLFRYCDADGHATPEANPNGSLNNIAGILNKDRNVLGMMPHPERAAHTSIGGADGLGVFQGVARAVEALELT